MSNKKTLTVYVCSPYAGDTKKNVEAARKYCRYVYERNAMPIAPHLLFPQFLDDDVPEEREAALAMGLELMGICNEVWVFGGIISAGMKGEIEHAVYWGKSVKYFTSDCEETSAPDAIDEDIPF